MTVREARPSPTPSNPGQNPAARPPELREDLGVLIVRDAAHEVTSSWRDQYGEATDPRDIVDVLQEVSEAVAARLGGATKPLSGTSVSTLGRRLVDLLRSTVIRRALDPAVVPHEQLLRVLTAIEAVREQVEPDWARYFTSRLAGPEGHELLVEVAHDLRSPLTSILFLAETLQRGQSGEVNDLQRRQLGLVYGAALGLSSLASDLIELVRGGDRLLDQEEAPFSITEILESVRDIVRPIAEEKRLKVRILPPPTDHRRGHHLALSRVLLNLTSNALKFTEEGFVELVCRATDRYRVEFSVRDTGKGINPEVVNNLYQPFRRTGGRRSYYLSGTGLGLAICRRIVEAMGGELKVESRPDWGTRFYFEINLPPAQQF
ncbi:MAG TPA: HAMP domain-containing sensor histidine kinase [Gemmatimonadales bacterium]|nr:HAMP domain-containing sensor histidine kinase [Gemmatimonadales bacterium]